MTRVARPPGPGPSRFVRGLLPGGDPLAFVIATAAAHPRVAHLRLAGEHVYVLSDPDLAWALLVTHGRSMHKGRGVERMRRFLGEGLLTSEGEHHRAQRRLVAPAFHTARIAAYAPVMVAAAREVDARWRAAGPTARAVDLAAQMSALTLAVVGRALFGTDLAAASAKVAPALAVLLEAAQRNVLPGAELLLRLPSRRSTEVRDGLATLDTVVHDMIDQRRAGPPGDDLLWTLLAARDATGAPVPAQRVRDEVMTLMLAGHETTATALTWAWYLLARHPRAARWLHDEVDARAAARPDGLAYDDMVALPRTTAVLAEAMRLYPPAWVVGRRATADVVVDGWTVPAGSLFVTSPYVLHRDPRWWAHPEDFRPDRWLDAAGRFDEAAPGQPRGAWLPFAAGARVCVGEPFAWAEGVLVLATLAAGWAPRLSGDVPVRPHAAITLRPSGGLPVWLAERSASPL